MEEIKKTKISYFIVIIIVGALIGSVIGEIVKTVLPRRSLINKIFIKGIEPKIDIKEIDLKIINFGFNIELSLNLCSVLGIILAILIYRKFQT
jgi:hypothetical protein